LTIAYRCGEAGPASKKSSFTGLIAAYRPADRLQVVSAVSNTEVVLFQRDGANRGLLKIVYVHQGFSDLKDEVLSGERRISVTVRRDSSCDQSMAAFEKEAPVIPVQGDGATASTK